MMDVFSREKRSEVMSRIRGTGNKQTELALISIFRRHGITGWRRRQKVFGRPDFVFRSLKLAVFVDGCFWHGCPEHGTMPKNNRFFWKKKFAANKARDREVEITLKKAGWAVLRIWAHELKPANEKRLLARIRRCMRNADTPHGRT